MKELEQRISDAVNEKLNDGTVEKLIEQHIEKAVSQSLDGIFGYSGSGKKMIQSKLDEIMIPVIENHDFNRYIVKLDSVLTEIINNTSLKDNKDILEKFKGLMKEPNKEKINLSDVFEEYKKYVAANVDTSELEAHCEDGEPYYDNVTATMEVEHEDKRWFSSSFDDCTVKFICDEDEKLNTQIKLYKRTNESRWSFRFGQDVIDINSLRYTNEFSIFIATLNRSCVRITMDTEMECDDDIEPDEKPEWDLN